jgi:uncharacterized protein
MIQGTILNEGAAQGPVLALTEPVSFWGAYDPRSGKIVDAHHPQSGACLAGHILMLEETRGSGGTPGGIAEAIRLGTAPLGIILVTPDINLAIGAAVAAKLYGRACPVISVEREDYLQLVQQKSLAMSASGEIYHSTIIAE